MEQLEVLFEIEYTKLIVSTFCIILAINYIVPVLKNFFFDMLGIETKFQREKREQKELLASTVESLNKLTEKQLEDTRQSIIHDERIKNSLDEFMNEVKHTIQELKESRESDREINFDIHKELTESVKALTESKNKHDSQISSMLKAQKESLCDKINQRYKHYLSMQGVPEDEVDEFVSLHKVYKEIGGNSTGDAKFDYCMKHLKIIPVEINLKFDEDNE